MFPLTPGHLSSADLEISTARSALVLVFKMYFIEKFHNTYTLRLKL